MQTNNETIDQSSRKMPECVREGLITVQGGMLYLKASHRILWMRLEHPDWSVVTSVVYADYDKGFVVMQATIMDETGRVLATAHSEESRGKFPYLKKAETGAIARALAIAGFGTQFGEIEEDADEDSIADSPRASRAQVNAVPGSRRQASAGAARGAGSINTGPGTCASCRAPSGKPHGSGCTAAAVAA
jgi:hypothetical protein